jgi:hypothetical protein
MTPKSARQLNNTDLGSLFEKVTEKEEKEVLRKEMQRRQKKKEKHV